MRRDPVQISTFLSLVLRVDARAAHASGQSFFQSANGV